VLAQLLDDALHLLDRTLRRILIGRPQPCTQQLVAGEDVQRQIAVAVVVAVEEALRLMAIQRDVGRIQVKHDLIGCRRMRFDIEVSEQPVDGLCRVADLVIAPAAADQFHPIQRALARQRFVQFPLAAEQSQQRIRAQLLMIVEVLVAQRQPVNALPQHLRQRVLDEQRRTAIAETTRQTAQQVDFPIQLAQQ
jgi:hypothetical protein